MHSVLFRSHFGSGFGSRTLLCRSHFRWEIFRRRSSQSRSFPSTAILLDDLAINPASELVERGVGLNVAEIPSEAEPVEALIAQQASVEMLLGEAGGVILGDLLRRQLLLENMLGLLGKGGPAEGAVEDAGEAIFGFHECIILYIMGGHFN